MKDFLSFIISFCIVLAVTGGFSLIFPTGKMSKSVKYIAVLSVICSFLGLFCLGFKVNVNWNFENARDTFSFDGGEITKTIFENALKSNDINYSKISVITDKTQDGSIIISKIIIYSDASKEEIMKIIGNEKEYEVEVIDE